MFSIESNDPTRWASDSESEIETQQRNEERLLNLGEPEDIFQTAEDLKRKRKFKRRATSPKKEMEVKKVRRTAQNGGVKHGNYDSRRSVPNASLGPALEKKKSIAEIFARDAHRRKAEAELEEAKQREIEEAGGIYVDPSLAKCAECNAYFEKFDESKSCHFHPSKFKCVWVPVEFATD